MRIRPLAALSAVALSAVLLAGCSSSAPEADAEPVSAPAVADLCARGRSVGRRPPTRVTVDGDGRRGVRPRRSTAPLEITELQSAPSSSRATGDPVESGELVAYALDRVQRRHRREARLDRLRRGPRRCPVQISPDNPVGQFLGCATAGTRVVVAFPPATRTPAQVYVFDFLDIVPNAAWGEPQEPVAACPTVELAEDGAPTITIPDGDAPTEVELATLKKGDGAVVAAGRHRARAVHRRQVVGRHRLRLELGDAARRPRSRPPAWSTASSQALEGQTVGSQVLVVDPAGVRLRRGRLVRARARRRDARLRRRHPRHPARSSPRSRPAAAAAREVIG